MGNRSLDLRTCFVAPLLRINTDLIYRIMKQVVEANSAFIEELNRKQLQAGTNADGTDIRPEYTEVTEHIKRTKGQPTDRVTLKDSGAFYESIFTNVFSDAFELKADDPKTAELTAKYGGGIFGLSPENRMLLIDRIKPQFIALLRAELR